MAGVKDLIHSEGQKISGKKNSMEILMLSYIRNSILLCPHFPGKATLLAREKEFSKQEVLRSLKQGS